MWGDFDSYLANRVTGSRGGSGGGVSSWNDLTDKPFDRTEDVVFSATDLVGEDMGAGFLVEYREGCPFTGEETTVHVLFDGTEYVCEVVDAQEGKIFGNSSFWGGEDNGVPFVCAFIAGQPDAFMEIILFDGNAHDIRFTVKGETIKTDCLPEHLQFGEVATGGDTLTWDGNTEGLENIQGSGFKVSDVVLTRADFDNGCTFVMTDASGNIECADVSFNETGDMLVVTGKVGDGSPSYPLLISGTHEGFAAIDASVDVPSGTYLPSMVSGGVGYYVSRVTINGYTGFPNIKKIDPKYLPDSLPEVSASDNGKFLRVVDGAWAVESLNNAEGVEF